MIDMSRRSKSRRTDLKDDTLRSLAMLESVLERAGLLPEDLDYKWLATGRIPLSEPTRGPASIKMRDDETLADRIERLESLIHDFIRNQQNEKREPQIHVLAAHRLGAGRSIESMRGLVDLFVQKTFTEVDGVKKVLAETRDSEIIYHIFTKRGCVGKLIRGLVSKGIEIQDFFENIPIDFKVHDALALSVLDLSDAELVIDKGGSQSHERDEVKQVPTS